jgi:hypothetical protein
MRQQQIVDLTAAVVSLTATAAAEEKTMRDLASKAVGKVVALSSNAWLPNLGPRHAERGV